MFGTAASGMTVVEKQSGVFHVTEIQIPETTLITTTGGENKAAGLLLYTLPAGSVNLLGCAMHVYLTGTTAHENDTPEVALGTTIASGAQATLGAVAATAEDLFGPFVMSGIEDDGTEGALNLSGAAGTTANNATGKLFVGTDTRTVHLNIADGWAATAGSVKAEGTVWLTWVAL
jgi:hypothetical protein